MGGCGVRLEIPGNSPGVPFLALRGEQDAHAPLQHDDLRNADRHGDRLQIDPRRCSKVARHSVIHIRFRSGGDGEAVPSRIPRVRDSITYTGRGYEEGKKITWKDGVRALRALLRWGLTVRRRDARRVPV